MKKSKLYTFIIFLILFIGVTQSVLSNPLPIDITVYWMNQPSRVYYDGSAYMTELNVDTLGSTRLAAYGIIIKYDPDVITPARSSGNYGVEAGPGGFVSAVYVDTPGELRIAGFDVDGKTDMTLFKVYWDINFNYYDDIFIILVSLFPINGYFL